MTNLLLHGVVSKQLVWRNQVNICVAHVHVRMFCNKSSAFQRSTDSHAAVPEPLEAVEHAVLCNTLNTAATVNIPDITDNFSLEVEQRIIRTSSNLDF